MTYSAVADLEPSYCVQTNFCLYFKPINLLLKPLRTAINRSYFPPSKPVIVWLDLRSICASTIAWLCKWWTRCCKLKILLKCSSFHKLLLFPYDYNCNCFMAKGIVSVVFLSSIILSKSIEPFMWGLTRAASWPRYYQILIYYNDWSFWYVIKQLRIKYPNIAAFILNY